MKKAFSLILTLSLSAGLLAGCSGSGTEKRVVNVCSWGEYIDESLIQQFEEATGIEVNYQTSPSNEELYSSLTLGGTSYDVIVPSDYMISQLIEEDMLQPLDYDKIPNFSKIADRFKNLSYDPENLYTVPYTWGTLGIIYNSTMVDQPITSWDAMFDPQYADQVLMINNSRDALGIALMDLGYSVNTDSEEELRAAYDLLAEAKKAGVYQAWVMDEVFDKMEAGEAAVATYYAGDYLSICLLYTSFSSSNSCASAANRGSTSGLHPHGPRFRSAPHLAHSPLQSSEQRFFVSIARTKAVVTSSSRSTSLPSRSTISSFSSSSSSSARRQSKGTAFSRENSFPQRSQARSRRERAVPVSSKAPAWLVTVPAASTGRLMGWEP